MEKQEKAVGSEDVRALSRNEMGEIVGGAVAFASLKSVANLKALLSTRALYGADYLANLGRDIA